MVLPDRIELSTSPLPMECSTTELRQHTRGLPESAVKAPTGGAFSATRPPAAQARGSAIGPQNAAEAHPGRRYPFNSVNCGPIRVGKAGGPRRYPIFAGTGSPAYVSAIGAFALGSRRRRGGRSHDDRSTGRRTTRRRGAGSAARTVEAGAARKPQAAKVAGPGAQQTDPGTLDPSRNGIR